MSSIDLHIGPFNAVYVGIASGSDVLTQLVGITTDDHRVSIEIPEVYNYSARNYLQAGPLTFTASMTFLSDDPDIWRLAYGNFLDAAWQDSASEFVKLELLLIHPDSDAESSFLIPECSAKKSITMNASKRTPTILPITFTWQCEDRYQDVYFKRTPDDLATILGSRSPL